MAGTDQSYVDLDDPTRLEFDYVQRIADALDAHAPAGQRLRVVHVGGAGLTLPRYLAASRPQSAQIVLEPDAELTEFVREHLPLPRRSGIKVRPVDGRAGIAEMRDDFADVVVVDAFTGAQVPSELSTTTFFADVHRVLAADGTVMVNVTDRAPFGYLRRCVAGVREHFTDTLISAEPATLKGRRFGNVLILGSKGRLASDLLVRKAASSAFPYRIVRGEHLDQLVGSAAPFTETDSSPSPEPPSGLGFFG
nr:fused MFS/spermidine synthase [Microlunatus panaciterrae]